ncbi:proline--tRNA ligase [Chlamydiota bacterium]
MYWTKTFIPTIKEAPQEAEVASHKLMIRAGLIQKLGSGLYTFLPLGTIILKKIMNIIRQELDRRGAIELLMPILQPRQIWEESGRWEVMTQVMLRVTDRQEKEFVLGPTHEEIITDIVAKRINSYRELPKNFYQIQMKFRDEIRPRFGVIRAKEFIMKDGYSFDVSEEMADKQYQEMYDAYLSIFQRCGLEVWPVEADTGVMGGDKSHEFMVLTEIGEDQIVHCNNCGYAANRELAKRMPKEKSVDNGSKEIEEIHTPGLKKVDELTSFFKKGAHVFIKTLLYTSELGVIAVLIRGDSEINENKLRDVLQVKKLALADEKTIEKVTGASVGFSGPVGLKGMRIVPDLSVQTIADGITGANKTDYHLTHVNIARDCSFNSFYDIGYVKTGDRCRNCKEDLSMLRGIEVGQVFKLGTKYSKKLGATFLDEKGKNKPAIMGCYGIGVTRLLAAFIESSHDECGILWNTELAPYQVAILPIHFSIPEIKKSAESLYNELVSAGIDVILDDREVSPGFKFKDCDLIGFPIRIVISNKTLQNGHVELKLRKEKESLLVKIEKVRTKVLEMLNLEVKK